MIPATPDSPRLRYLRGLLDRNDHLLLPLGVDAAATSPVPLAAIAQPLRLRFDPLAAVDLPELGVASEAADDEDDEDDEDEEDEGQPRRLRVPSVGEALAHSPAGRMIVLGEPGSGKTTALRQLVRHAITVAAADPTAPLPLYLSLPDLAPTPALEWTDLARLGSNGMPESATLLTEAGAEGHLLVCLDSLDEVAPAARSLLIAQINRWAAQAGNQWVVGSRFSDYKGGQFAPGQFSEWELEPLDPPAQRLLAARLLPLFHPGPAPLPDPDGAVTAFLAALGAHRRAGTWRANPLLFTLAARVWGQQGDLPGSRAALYRLGLEALLAARLPDPAQRATVRPILATLALGLQRRAGRVFTRPDLRAALPPTLPDAAQQEWAEAVLASGVIAPVSTEPASYRFYHQTFQEYLAALALAAALVDPDPARAAPAWDEAWAKRQYSRWTEVLQLLVGVLVQEHGPAGIAVALHWVRDLLGQRATPAGDPGDLGLTLALRSLGEIAAAPHAWPAADAEHLAAVLDAWVAAVLDPGRSQRAESTRRLRGLAREIGRLRLPGLEQALAPLIAAVRGPSDRARALALDLLADLGPGAPVAPLLVALRNKDDSIRDTAAYALRDRAADVPVADLLAALGDSSRWVRMSIAGALGTLGAQAPIAALVAALGAADPDTRRGAIGALWHLAAAAPLEPVVAALTDADWEVRSEAPAVLGQMGARAAEASPIAALGQALLEGDRVGVRIPAAAALQTLAPLAPPAVLVPILLAALGLEDNEPRGTVIATLAGLGPLVPVEALLALLDAGTAPAAGAAAAVLGQRGDCAPVAALEARLAAANPVTRDGAVWALGWLGDRAPLDPLLRALKDADATVRSSAVVVLGRLGARVPLAPLLKALRDPVVEVRDAALRAVAPRASEVPLRAWRAALNDPEYPIPYTVAEVIGGAGAQAPIEDLLRFARRAVRDEDEDLTQPLGRSLQTLRAYLPSDQLVTMLGDRRSDTRYVAEGVLINRINAGDRDIPLTALATLATDRREAVRALAEEIRTRLVGVDPAVYLAAQVAEARRRQHVADQQAALDGLGGLGAAAPLAPLLAALADPEPAVQVAALGALGQMGTAAPAAPLLAALRSTDPAVVAAAAAALGARGPEIPIAALVAVVLAPPERRTGYWYRARAAAATALLPVADQVPDAALLAALDDDETAVQEAVVTMLGGRGAVAPVDALIARVQAAAKTDRSPIVTAGRGAARSLGRLRAAAGVPALIQALGNKSGIRREAAYALLDIGGPALPQARLVEVVKVTGEFQHGPDFLALAALGDRAPLDLLLPGLEGPRWEARQGAARALGYLAARAPVEPLVAALHYLKKGEEWETDQARAAALWALGQVGDRAPVDEIVAALEDPGKGVREAAAQALGALGDRAPLEPLVRVLRGDQEPEVRRAVARALVGLGARVPTAVLVEALGEAGPEVVAELAARPPAEALPALTAALDHPLVLVRSSAATALAAFGPAAPEAALRQALGEADGSVRQAAAQTLAATHPATLRAAAVAAEALLAGTDPGPTPVHAPGQALYADWIGQLDHLPPTLLEQLSDLLDNPEPGVQQAAAGALGRQRRNIPDRAVRRLMTLYRAAPARAVREAADAALAAILSLEAGLEVEES